MCWSMYKGQTLLPVTWIDSYLDYETWMWLLEYADIIQEIKIYAYSFQWQITANLVPIAILKIYI